MNEKSKLHNQLKRFLQVPIIFSVLWIAVSVCMFFIDFKAGVVSSVATLIFLVSGLIIYLVNKTKVEKKLAEYGAMFSQVQRQMIRELDIPYSLLDISGKILWSNDAMKRLLVEENIHHKHIDSMFTEVNLEEIEFTDGIAQIEVEYNKKNFKIVLKKYQLLDNNHEELADDIENHVDFINMFMFDETELKLLKKENVEEKLVSGLIYIDNYDEALQNLEDVRRTMIFALVERKINKYISSMDGIVRKLENDKYFVAVKAKYIPKMQSDKFSLLDDVKSVNMGNDLPITISIGLGMGGESYLKNSENARAAMDMALGRGGDQAVIKDAGKIYYYGGKSKTVEKNTRVKARVKALALRELVLTRDMIFVMGHKVGDMDSFGASVGIYRAAKAMGKTVHIVINEMNSTARQMFVKFTPEEGYEEDLFVSNEQALELANRNTLVIVVDVNRPNYTECPELIKKAGGVVVLDHHRQSTEIFDGPLLSYIEPYASSTCEMVAEILQYIEDGLKLKQQEADAMYGGITIDTNNFTNRTGVRTFEAAAFLRRNGADVTRVRKMFRDDMEDFRARAKAIQQAEIYMDQFAISVCPAEGINMPTVVGSQAANELLNIKGIKATFVCTEYNNQVYISARSIDDINVQVVMERLGGGGHINLAGAQIKESTCEEVVQLIKDTLKQMKEEGDI